MRWRPPEVPNGLDPALLGRLEEAGINASAPREQRLIDGWLVRFSPGKAKRGRCIQAVAPGRLSVADKLARCLPVFVAAGLRPYLRVTPFSEPQGVDGELARLGWEKVDDTRVMVRLPAREAAIALPPGARIEPIDAARFADWIGRARGSSDVERRAHAERIAASPVPYTAFVVRDDQGTEAAGGQVAIEGEVAGLYDVFSLEAHRGRGLASALCSALLAHARRSGAGVAYLQVDAANEAARRAYRRLGFADGYAYHYRTPIA